MTQAPKPRLRRKLAKALEEAREWFDGPSLMVAPDIRRLAGVEPALEITVGVPAEGAALCLQGMVQLHAGHEIRVVEPLRSEYWILGPLPREAVEVSGLADFSARSAKAMTLYKLYFALPASGEWQFDFPAMTSETHEFAAASYAGKSEDGCAMLIAEGPSL